MISDAQLVQLAKEGQIKAFESLVDKYKDRVFNIAFSFTSNFTESDDIAQNVFLKVYRNIGSFKEESAFSTWLYRIAVNECFNGIKSRTKNTISIETEIAGGENVFLKDILQDTKTDIEEQAIAKEAQNTVRKALLKLPEKYRIILTLREIENISYEEIAQIMKISDAKVKVWLFRGRNKLKKLLNIKG